MANIEFKVSISPKKAFEIVKENVYADELIESELKQIDENRAYGVLVFDKYYMRVSSRAALVVLIDNINGDTTVKAISTGAGTGWVFKFDWGAENSFVNEVRNALKNYMIE